MASTTFVDGQTVIEAAWLNDVNAVVYTPGTTTAADVANVPAGNIVATDVQAALNELDTEKQPLDAQLTTLAGITAQQAIDLASVSTFMGTMLDDADAATARATLGVEASTTGTWTPALTFATPGDLNVTYTAQFGSYVKIGSLVVLDFSIVTSAFTHTTASGAVKITGVPFASANDLGRPYGAIGWQGITKANYTDAKVRFEGAASQILTVYMSGSGQNQANLTASDFPTGGTVILQGSISYRV